MSAVSLLKISDRVRCTLGESMLVGVVDFVERDPARGFCIAIEGQRSSLSRSRIRIVPKRDPWSIEVLPPPAPEWSERDGAVCRFRSGWQNTWIRGVSYWHRASDPSPLGVSFNDMCALMQERDEKCAVRYTEPVCLHDPGAVA